MTTPVVSIAFHSGFGHTAVLAEAVRAGAAETGATVHLIEVDKITEEQWALLDASDAIVFGSPTYMGTASGAFHTFAEATSKRWFTHAWRDKLAAGFTNSGSKSGDKLHTLQFFGILAGQHGMHWVSLGLHPGWNTSEASENDLNRLGFFLGAGAQSNNDQGPEGVHKADVETAAHLGRRVAEQARIFAAGRAAL
ncbi:MULTISPECIES: flavodoxin family protein [Streptomyces]|uniref:flavodoxin family protein n=1 Tax=Streptomyces TaxID=1883 RepID=UPI00163D2FD2|nr:MULTISPECIES: flavodoxin family protein [Streptomyces]MBC2874667.1 flavodoxin family protein [Streptomyces sp. TYQ1024]UBI36570.1 flavodoxin family protein [Streptomyces mobaraensis]UKW29161.1 flavodoxin family protein [Streptomyces sp. TYQ1024]